MSLSIIEETKKILENTQKLINEKEKKYYRDILDFLNLIFETESKSITDIKVKKITIDEDIFTIYNAIIKKYKLDKPLIDIEKFDSDYEYETKEVINLVTMMCNNLLHRIHYHFKKIKDKITQKDKYIIIMNK